MCNIICWSRRWNYDERMGGNTWTTVASWKEARRWRMNSPSLRVYGLEKKGKTEWRDQSINQSTNQPIDEPPIISKLRKSFSHRDHSRANEYCITSSLRAWDTNIGRSIIRSMNKWINPSIYFVFCCVVSFWKMKEENNNNKWKKESINRFQNLEPIESKFS